MRELRPFIERYRLLRPGDRVGVALSGGADSVALLTSLVEASSDLGIVLSVVHFNHKLRGSESEEDEQFVRNLAQKFDLPIHVTESDTRCFAREKELSIEAGARELRYSFFGRLIADNHLDKVATAHTLDDQAETVLLRVFRGTGTSGLSGIHPRLVVGAKSADWKGIVRPFLGTRRKEIEDYLRMNHQPWRTDSTNSETVFTRNRLRHNLLPLIEKGFNPDIVSALANLAEIARAEDEYWSAETAKAFVTIYHNQAVDIDALLRLPQALQRRVLRLVAIQSGATLDFLHAERILEQLGKGHSQVELPNHFRAAIDGKNLRFESNLPRPKPCGYSYRLTIPGEVELRELNVRVRAVLIPDVTTKFGCNDAPALAFDRLPRELLLRNWRPGDRFWPAHTSSPRKVKELLQPLHLSGREKSLWPVVVAGNDIVWIRGFPVASPYVATQGKAVALEEFTLEAERT
jgi:tRNA(Ile)-lysidine synthase